MDMSKVFMNDVSELYGKDFYYSKRAAKTDFKEIKAHAHKHYELYYLTKGSRKFFVKNKLYIISAGDVILVKPDTIHYTAANDSSNHERILLNFTEDYISADIKDRTENLLNKVCINIPENHRRITETIFERITAEYQKNDAYSFSAQKLLLSELLIDLLRLENNAAYNINTNHNPYNPISGLLEYIGNNLSSAFSLEEAAAYAGFSKSHFARIFKAYTGFTFNDYLQLQRLLKARYLLEKTADNITSIAYDCGFSNSGYFSTVFKNYFGMTPYAYRKIKKM